MLMLMLMVTMLMMLMQAKKHQNCQGPCLYPLQVVSCLPLSNLATVLQPRPPGVLHIASTWHEGCRPNLQAELPAAPRALPAHPPLSPLRLFHHCLLEVEAEACRRKQLQAWALAQSCSAAGVKCGAPSGIPGAVGAQQQRVQQKAATQRYLHHHHCHCTRHSYSDPQDRHLCCLRCRCYPPAPFHSPAAAHSHPALCTFLSVGARGGHSQVAGLRHAHQSPPACHHLQS
mmetsp:Transcript_11626/g.30427  ORF Transcript_11626/g.30427 Transcript_11626/m.30427 type:complete len:230 (-) Transcript_11626:360-1049(-)